MVSTKIKQKIIITIIAVAVLIIGITIISQPSRAETKQLTDVYDNHYWHALLKEKTNFKLTTSKAYNLQYYLKGLIKFDCDQVYLDAKEWIEIRDQMAVDMKKIDHINASVSNEQIILWRVLELINNEIDALAKQGVENLYLSNKILKKEKAKCDRLKAENGPA